jgi:hypothetical protein
MPATNAKMDFEAFGVRDIELSRLRPGAARVKDVLRFDPIRAGSGRKVARDLTGQEAAGKVSGR